MIVYVVKMNRWGDDELHSYVLGVFSSRLQAGHAGYDEERSRGGKYSAQILEFNVDALVI